MTSLERKRGWLVENGVLVSTAVRTAAFINGSLFRKGLGILSSALNFLSAYMLDMKFATYSISKINLVHTYENLMIIQ